MPENLDVVKKELRRRIARAELELDEALEDHGEDSREFLWRKCKLETLEEVMWSIDPNYNR